MTEYKLKFDVEICCKECNEVIHVHFDCPICNTKNASTNLNYSINDMRYFGIDNFVCEICFSVFKIKSEGKVLSDFIWELVEKND
jgi:hypothetical protein